MTHEELKSIEGGILLLSGDSVENLMSKLSNQSFDGPSFDEDACGRRLSVELMQASDFNKSDSYRMAIVATSWADYDKRVGLALKAMQDSDKWGFLQSQGVMITNEPVSYTHLTLPTKA